MKENGRFNMLLVAAVAAGGLLVFLAPGGLIKPSLSVWPEYSLPPVVPASAKKQSGKNRKIPEAWDDVETLGDEGEAVEAVLEEGKWRIFGERLRGVPIYKTAPFQVPARKVEDVPFFPCSDCHKKDSDYRVRTLKEKHKDLELRHDKNMWCHDCHNGKAMDTLIGRNKKVIDMDLGYILCGQCHFREAKDWHGGAHGKRIGLWRGTRVLQPCTTCHNPHTPAIQKDDPAPAPLVRTGLKRKVTDSRPPLAPWKQLIFQEKMSR